MKRFGGPGEIRTHDLFHAMEARSQLRHRPGVRNLEYTTVPRRLTRRTPACLQWYDVPQARARAPITAMPVRAGLFVLRRPQAAHHTQRRQGCAGPPYIR